MNSIADTPSCIATEEANEVVSHEQLLELTSLDLALVGGGQASMAFY